MPGEAESLGFGMVVLLVAAISISSCRKSASPTVSSDQPKSKLQVTEARVLDADEQSCKVFVQKFYDWYWNQFADEVDDPKFDTRKLHVYDDPLQLKPPVLSKELARLIEKDRQASRAAGGDIVSLDFDPFLNSNGPVGKYTVRKVEVLDGACQANIEGGHGVREVAELKKSGSGWLFANFQYSYYSEDGKTKEFPDNDLVHILSR